MRLSGLLVAAALAASALADDLTIGVQTDARSMDPHVAPSFTSSALHQHVFDALIATDTQLRLIPSLATAWRPEGDHAWIIELRQGVRFSDGTPFTAEDVLASLRRINAVRHGAGTYAPYARAITGAMAETPYRIRLETASPYPGLPFDLSRLRIVSARAAEAEGNAFNTGAAAIGTGPFRLRRWVPNERLELTRNPGHWGNATAWENVTFRPLANDTARLAALLSGDVDLIDKAPTSDMARLGSDIRFSVFVHDGNRTMFLVPDATRATTPHMADADGRPLSSNPMLDPRIRQAISLAINRPALAERVMQGFATPANQAAPAGMFGFSSAVPPAGYDPAAARRLLAEAGHPRGLRLVLHCSNGRYVNDRQTCLAVAQMLTRAGIQTQAEAEPQSVFYNRMARFDASLMLNGWGSFGDNLQVLRQALHSVDLANGRGSFNRGGYRNAAVDGAIEAADSTLNDSDREALQQEAMRAAMADVALVPLYTAAWVWAARRGLHYDAGFDEGTFATRVVPVR